MLCRLLTNPSLGGQQVPFQCNVAPVFINQFIHMGLFPSKSDDSPLNPESDTPPINKLGLIHMGSTLHDTNPVVQRQEKDGRVDQKVMGHRGDSSDHTKDQ